LRRIERWASETGRRISWYGRPPPWTLGSPQTRRLAVHPESRLCWKVKRRRNRKGPTLSEGERDQRTPHPSPRRGSRVALGRRLRRSLGGRRSDEGLRISSACGNTRPRSTSSSFPRTRTMRSSSARGLRLGERRPSGRRAHVRPRSGGRRLTRRGRRHNLAFPEPGRAPARVRVFPASDWPLVGGLFVKGRGSAVDRGAESAAALFVFQGRDGLIATNNPFLAGAAVTALIY